MSANLAIPNPTRTGTPAAPPGTHWAHVRIPGRVFARELALHYDGARQPRSLLVPFALAAVMLVALLALAVTG